MNVRRTCLITGLILLTYLTTHLLNHALGLISLDAMEAGRRLSRLILSAMSVAVDLPFTTF